MHWKRMASTLVGCIILFPLAGTGQSYCSRAIELTNTDDASYGYVRIADHPSLEPQQLTFEAWITPKGIGYGGTGDIYGAAIMAKPQEGQSGGYLASYMLSWAPASSRVYAYIIDSLGASGTILSSIGTVPLNTTAHVAMTFDGTTLKLFLNGQLDSEIAAASATIDYGNEDVLLGAGNWGLGFRRRFQGVIDEVRFWDHARDQATIAANMNAKPSWDESGLLAAYSFNGWDARDESGNGNHGVPEGTVGFPPVPDPDYLAFGDGFETGNATSWAAQVP